jgi:HTH-type transcriptional regulator/antitoxin HigA
MCKRHWIEPTDDIDLLEQQVLGFFSVKSLDELPKFLVAARKSTAYGEETPAQTAWLYRAKSLSNAVSAKSYTEAGLDRALERIRNLIHSPEEIRHVPRIMADAGVRVLIVEPLPNSQIDGACFWLDPKSPVIVLSLRFDRIDSFWHTFIHEVAHVKNKDGNILDIDIVGEHAKVASEKPESELKADKFAVEYLVPQAAFSSFIARHQPLYTGAKIQAFAKLHKVHPGIVLGQLHHKFDTWAYNRNLLVKVRHIVTEAALTDGWGQTLPAAM